MRARRAVEIRMCAAAAAALVLLPRLAWAHHFMDDQLPQTLAQGLLSGLGHPQFGVAAAALLTHRRLLATGGGRVRRLSGALGAAVGAIGILFLGGNVVA